MPPFVGSAVDAARRGEKPLPCCACGALTWWNVDVDGPDILCTGRACETARRGRVDSPAHAAWRAACGAIPAYVHDAYARGESCAPLRWLGHAVACDQATAAGDWRAVIECRHASLRP